MTICFAPTSYRLVGVGMSTAYRVPYERRGPSHFYPSGPVSNQRLPTDSVGSFALTLSGLVAGSAIQVEVATTGVVVSNTTAGAATVTLTLPAYAAGSANNNLRIKVRKGSVAPFYIAYETLATAFVGAQTIFVSQIPD